MTNSAIVNDKKLFKLLLPGAPAPSPAAAESAEEALSGSELEDDDAAAAEEEAAAARLFTSRLRSYSSTDLETQFFAIF